MAHVTASSLTSGVTLTQPDESLSILNEPEIETCLHRWTVGSPKYHWTQRNNHGDLVETVNQRCKLCGEIKDSQCVIEPESPYRPSPKRRV